MTDQKVTGHFVGKVALKAVIEHNNRVLLMRDSRERREIWEIPGGRMDVDEVPAEALARELQEELGISCDVHEVLHITQFWQGSENAQALMIAYRVGIRDPHAKLVLEPSEVAQVGWYSLNEALQLELFPEYRETLEIYKKKIAI